MKKVIIKQINGYDYILVDEDNNVYYKNIEFISKLKPKEKDIIYLSEKILDEDNLFTFADFNDRNNVKEDEIIKIISSDEKYYLIRHYG